MGKSESERREGRPSGRAAERKRREEGGVIVGGRGGGRLVDGQKDKGRRAE